MNRQSKGLTEGQGQFDSEIAEATPAPEARRTPARAATATAPNKRTTPRQFLHEVNVEMRKVAWPSRATTINYSTVVLITLALVMGLLFGLDYAFSQFTLFLFK